MLDARQLVLLDFVPLQQGGLLLWRQDPVLRHQLVLGDVDQQLRLREALHNQLATNLSDNTPAAAAARPTAASTAQREYFEFLVPLAWCTALMHSL